jgi:hypothetical protein
MSIPVDVTFHTGWWYKYTGVSFDENFFEDPKYRIESDLKMRKLLYEKFGGLGLGERDPKPRPLLGTDLLASGYLYSQIMGCPVRFSAANPPEVICRKLTETEIENLTAPDLSQNQYWQKTARQMEFLEEKFGWVESHLNLQGIQNIALDLRGEDLFCDYYDEPDRARKLIEVCTELSIDIGRRLSAQSKVLSHGVTSITAQVMPDVYLTSNCTVEMVSRNIYEQFLLEMDQRLAAVFHPFGIHHCGKTMEHVVEGYAKLPGLKFAEAGAGSDIATVRRFMPGVFLNLRYSPVTLKTATENEMATELEQMARAAGDCYSFSCVGIDAETDDRQVECFIRRVRGVEAGDRRQNTEARRLGEG